MEFAMPASIFFSYSHADEAMRDQLEKHLKLLQHQGLIETWHDRRIQAGAEFGASIDEAINKADIILLLVSSDFLASNYCYSIEMARAMERHHEGSAVVIPVVLRECDWHSAPFGKLLAAPKDGKPIDQWTHVDGGYSDVARMVRSVVEARPAASKKSTAERPPASSGAERQAAGVAHGNAPRSSNLSLPRAFSERERDQFGRDAFEFMARFFGNSLTELIERNPGIDGHVERIDAHTFTSVIYRHGKKIAECSISFGGPFRSSSIVFSFDPRSRGNSFNESLSVETDDQMMFLRSMGMSYRASRDEKLTHEGAAELFWAMLIERLR